MLDVSENIDQPIEDLEDEVESKPVYFSVFLNSINKTKQNLMRSGEMDPILAEKEFKGLVYVLNRVLGYFPQNIFAVQEMNTNQNLDAKMKYEFYLHSIEKNYRFAKGIKMESPEHLGLVKRYFNFSNKKARAALDILSPDDILFIQARLDEGGLTKKRK